MCLLLLLLLSFLGTSMSAKKKQQTYTQTVHTHKIECMYLYIYSTLRAYAISPRLFIEHLWGKISLTLLFFGFSIFVFLCVCIFFFISIFSPYSFIQFQSHVHSVCTVCMVHIDNDTSIKRRR